MIVSRKFDGLTAEFRKSFGLTAVIMTTISAAIYVPAQVTRQGLVAF